ncbi:MAG TPA: hypothetical protein VFA52_03990 [Candidatus Paceibacterota bacterium]|jgi:hypothetical protein|nr:hypothetical protein [Candidatus Paceibacterota bacterium]
MGVIKSYLINGGNPVTVGGVGTAIKYFANVPGAANWNSGVSGVNAGVSGAQTQGQTPSSTSNAGGLQVPGNNELNGQLFRVTASGNILFGAGEASTTGKVGLYLSNVAAGVAPNYQTILEETITNQAQDGVFYPWTIDVYMQGDTSSGLLQFYKNAWSMINGTATSAAAGTPISGISFATDPAFVLVVGVTFGASNSGNSANMYQFQVSLP